MRYTYPCEMVPDDGGVSIRFPDVPEALTCGEDRTEAVAMAQDALATALAGYVHERWNIPAPSLAADGQELIPVPPVTAAKLALYTAMRTQDVTNVDLARRLGVSEVRGSEAPEPRPSFPHRPGREGPARRGPYPGRRGSGRLTRPDHPRHRGGASRRCLRIACRTRCGISWNASGAWHRARAEASLQEKVRVLLELQRQDLPLIARLRPLRPWERPWDVTP